MVLNDSFASLSSGALQLVIPEAERTKGPHSNYIKLKGEK